MTITLRRSLLVLILLSAVLTACNFNPDPPTPTVEALVTPSPSPTLEVSLTASQTATVAPTVAAIRLSSATPSHTPENPTETPTATPTEGPYVVRVQPGEFLYGIIERFGYTDGRVIPAILTLNPNIPNEESLPVGQDILIPRMTQTPTPPNYEATVSIMGTLGIPLPDQLPANTSFECHTVIEGERVIDIAEQYDTTLEIISQLNPELVFRNCDLNNRSGGPECNVNIQIGQCVKVPMPTPTMTLSPTPSGNETATPTPTYGPPIVIRPPNGAIVTGPVLLEWISAGILKSDEYYYLEVINRTAGTQYTQVTKDTSWQLPSGLIPPEGEEHDIEWLVIVVRGDTETFSPIGGVMPERTFKWRRR